jgi:hypothetical protein
MPNTTTSNPVAAAIERAVNTVRRTALPMNMWAGNDVEALASRVYPALRKESLKYLCEQALYILSVTCLHGDYLVCVHLIARDVFAPGIYLLKIHFTARLTIMQVPWLRCTRGTSADHHGVDLTRPATIT